MAMERPYARSSKKKNARNEKLLRFNCTDTNNINTGRIYRYC
jgi:hypothetical protein